MSMCFAWWLADGYGPLQIVGDEKYRTKLALLNATNAKVEVRLRDIVKPDWTKSERCKCSVIKTKHIDTRQLCNPIMATETLTLFGRKTINPGLGCWRCVKIAQEVLGVPQSRFH